MPRQGITLILPLILLVACARTKIPPVAWTWTGANPQNTLQFGQAGTRPVNRMQFHLVWDAEKYGPTEFELPVGVAILTKGLVTLDLNGDGELEIIPSPVSSPPQMLLTAEGVPVEGGLQGNLGICRRVLLERGGDSALLVSVPEFEFDTLRASGPCWTVMLNGEPVLIELALPMDETSRSAQHAVKVSRLDGSQSWFRLVAPRPTLWAVADVNGDSADELLFGTYGEERGLRIGGTADSDSCYCLCFDEEGNLLWSRALGAHPFSGSRLCVADLDRDGRVEVIVGYYTWQNLYGRLYVLEGASGAVLAESPGPDSVPRSHNSVGCADIDGDGEVEVIATYCGSSSGVAAYRYRAGKLSLLRHHPCGHERTEAKQHLGQLDAIVDLDGDGRAELVVSEADQTMLCPDPAFYPSKYDSCKLTVLGPNLEVRGEIQLAQPCDAAVVADLVRGGNLELLVLSDRLSLYAMDLRWD